MCVAGVAQRVTQDHRELFRGGLSPQEPPEADISVVEDHGGPKPMLHGIYYRMLQRMLRSFPDPLVPIRHLTPFLAAFQLPAVTFRIDRRQLVKWNLWENLLAFFLSQRTSVYTVRC